MTFFRFPHVAMLIGLTACLTRVSAQIKEFHLTCNPSDFQLIYDNYEQDIYIPATFTYSGTEWSDVSIRIRGDGSRQLPKKSLKVRFNTGAFINGRTSLNLNAEWEDRSYMQQYVASRLMNESGQHCFTAEHVRVYLNGSFFGLYLMVEGVDERFFQERGLDPDGTTYKAALDGSSLSIFDVPQYHWEQKTGPDLNMSDLQQLIDGLNNTPLTDFGTYIDQAFVRSEVVNLIAMNMLLSLGSTYYHNYFMHHEPASDKWMMLPWDMDKNLLYYGSDFPYHRSSRVWEPDNPYLEKTIQDPQLLAEVRNRIVSLQSTIFNVAHIDPIIDSVAQAIAPSVVEDQTDDISGTTEWQTNIANFRTQFSQRVNALLAQIDEYPLTFTVERVGVAEPSSTVQLHWTASASPVQRPITYRFVFGNDPNLEAAPIMVQDNITDTLLSFNVPATEGQYFYKVQACDGVTCVDGFDSYNPLVVTNNVPPLVINEINYHSAPDHNTEDWVEIHNPLTYSVNLEGWQLKDGQNDHVFEFPSGSSIGPGSFVVVARDTTAFHLLESINTLLIGNLSFGFGNSGDAVRLFHSSGVEVDAVVYHDVAPWPEAADGLGPTLELLSPLADNSDPQSWTAWENRHGTPGAPNFTGTGVDETEENDLFSIYPNPTQTPQVHLAMWSDRQQVCRLHLYDMTGKLIHDQQLTLHPGVNRIPLRFADARSGTYAVRVATDTHSYFDKIIYNTH